jgi:hypothetical protein
VDVVRIERIVVRVGNVELEMTPDEARKLMGVLKDLLGDKNEYHYHYDFPPYKVTTTWVNTQPPMSVYYSSGTGGA